MVDFLKTLGRKFVAGFLILLPFLLAYLLIGGFVDLMVLLTQPLEDVLPHLGLMSPTARHVAVLGLLFSIFVVVGLVKDTKPAQRRGVWIEREFFFKFPPYRLVRDITRPAGRRRHTQHASRAGRAEPGDSDSWVHR